MPQDAFVDETEIITCAEPNENVATLPLVINSPHSGDTFPVDFDFSCSKKEIREGSDLFVDRLFADAPQKGAYLLCAQFPRSYIDVNRAVTDIDEKLLVGKWAGEIKSSERSYNGIGLIRRLCRAGVPVYDRLLTNEEIHHRIDQYYTPYHARMAAVLDSIHGRFGSVWHIDCHSMPSHMRFRGNSAIKRRHADFILGDREGSTCSREFRTLLRDSLIELGYSVRINDPYKGVEMVRRYGNPKQNRHALQLEINKDLYMDEANLALNDNFVKLKRDMNLLMDGVASYIQDKIKE